MVMDMNQLFKALPSDLQFEVLSEFVGTHTVRKGKLRRKIVYSTMIDGSLVRQLDDNTFIPVVNGLKNRQRLAWLHDRDEVEWPKYIRFSTLGNRQMQFCYDGVSGDTIFGYRKTVDYHILWEMQYPVARAEDAVVLPPFVRHDYPSYEHTDKKRRITLIR
jgi:hypothetical protein